VDEWERSELGVEFPMEILKGRDHSENTGIDEDIILKQILRKEDGRMRIRFMFLRIRPVADSCEHDNEHSGFINFLTS
jgi:hypothetical protein